MFSAIGPVFAICLSGSVLGRVENSVAHLPGLVWRQASPMQLWKKSDNYCYQFTWLGTNFHARNFHQVDGKNCSEFFAGKNKPLCVDPMVVSVTGKKPSIEYLFQNHPKEVIMRMSEGQVCAKYTVYSNGVPSLVVRYPALIYMNDGSMESQCVQQTDGAFVYELCACKSVPGSICNASPDPSPSIASVVALVAVVIGATWCIT